ncbi:hypothetical protein [Zooshikella harenae]|uniref:Chromosome partitioning protein ParA n=1 Tax=Zooshikella harenae TaxID=2827238 RepID=A0ABS5Z7C7_9GAMM|nr:hypothetical protein [Zooshikella harenae]MBU2709954.1 hypothetical protein [Zooshikella harenae]
MKKFAEAVMFFNTKGICKQMLMSEFEAVLDGVVHVEEFKTQTVKGAYVQIDANLHVTAIVLFLLDFDREGMADRSWNVPLKHMSSVADKGPNLGAGPIRLATRTNCPVNWHHSSLWDYRQNASVNELVLIKAAAKRNRLRLFTDTNSTPVVKLVQNNEPEPTQLAAARAIKAVKLHEEKLVKLASQSKEEIARLKQQFSHELARYKQELVLAKQANEQLANKNRALVMKLENQKQQFQESRNEMTQLLKEIEQQSRAELATMQQQLEFQIRTKVRSATQELKEQLRAKEVEQEYLEELDKQQQIEIKDLHKEIARLQSGSPHQLLDQLAAKGVIFVAYHPGVGHVTIPLNEVERYLEDNIAYVATKCFVSKEHYLKWRRHYESSRCEAVGEDGKSCGKSVKRIDMPGQFIDGDSNRCETHKNDKDSAPNNVTDLQLA